MKIFVVPYCHADWAWTHTRHWHEERYCLVFQEVLDIMKKNKEFKWYLDSYICQLEPFLRLCPERVPELRRRIKEGRIAVCGSYTNLRPNMVGEETLVRDLLFGRRIFRKLFPEVDLSVQANTVDVASTHPQMPQILKLAGYRYFRFWRPQAALSAKKIPLEFYWKGLDGTVILTSRGSYSGLCSSESFTKKEGFHKDWTKAKEDFFSKEVDYAKRGSPTGIIWLSQGTDDTRPLRGYASDEKLDLLEFGEEWNKREDIPLAWATPPDFYRELEKVKSRIPTVSGTIEPCDVCYNASWYGSRGLWRLRIICDQVLVEAEKWLTIAGRLGLSYPHEKTGKLWRNILKFSSHATQWLFQEDFDQLYQLALQTRQEADQLRNQAFETITSRIRCKKKPLAIIFNSSECDQTCLVPVTVSFTDRIQAGNFSIQDSSGRNLPYQITSFLPDSSAPWEFQVLVKVDLPGSGYNCLYLKPARTTFLPGKVRSGVRKLENDRFTLRFKGGCLTEIADRISGIAYRARKDNTFGLIRLIHLDPEGILHVGKILGEEKVVWRKWQVTEDGNLRKICRSEGTIGKHQVRLDTILYDGEPRIEFKVEVNWRQAEKSAFLAISVPFHFPTGKLHGDIPFGVEEKNIEQEPYGALSGRVWDSIERLIEGMFFAKSFVDCSDGKHGLALVSHDGDRYFVWNKKEKVLSHIMVRSIRRPDNWEKDINWQVEGIGRHQFTYSLIFHSGDYRKGKICQWSKRLRSQPVKVQRFPVFSKGILPDCFSFIKVEPENISITAIYQEEKKTFLRLYEANGRKTRGRLTLFFKPGQGRTVSFNLRPWEIRTLRLSP